MYLTIFTICQNEEATVAELIKRMPKKIPGIDKIEVFVVDDGSSDRTAEEARSCGVEVYSNGAKKRLAYSFQKAVDIALRKGADIVVNIDGDLQYQPEDIPDLVIPIIEGKADFTSATRFLDKDGKKRGRPKNMPIGNYYGNILGAFIINKLTGKKFSDVTNGFRAYNREALMLLNINGKYTYTQESFQFLATQNLNIVQIPVTIKYFEGRESRVVSSLTKFIFNSAINILRSFRDFAPLVFFSIVGSLSFVIGLVMTIGVLIHYWDTGSFSPYKYVGFGGLFFIAVGIMVWIVGLVGDMLDRVLRNQEKILHTLKEIKYRK